MKDQPTAPKSKNEKQPRQSAKPPTTEPGQHQELTQLIRKGLKAVGIRLRKGISNQSVLWVIKDQLAVSHRPLRNHPRCPSKRPPSDTGPLVEEWVRTIVEVEKIKSIICLLHDDELIHNYGHLGLHEKGLLGYYEHQGLVVKRYPMRDNKKKTPFLEVARRAAAYFPELPKPALVHCAGGADRTPPVAALIAIRCRGELCV